MSDKINLKVTKRKVTGRKVKQLRQEKIIPANIYGKNIKSLAVQAPLKDFHQAFKQAGETGIVNLTVTGETKSRPTLIHNIHRHPVTDYYLHADFYQVDLTKKVTVDIPIELTGEAPAISKGGVLIQLRDEVKVEALPTDLPSKFEIDVSKLEEIGQGISLKDIKLAKDKVTLAVDDPNQLIVRIEEPAKEEEKPVEAETPEGEEVPEGEETPEGEEVPEGEAKPEAEKTGDKKPAPSDAKPDTTKQAKAAGDKKAPQSKEKKK